MKPLSLSLSLLLLTATTVQAQTTWTLQDKTYAVDTVYHATVGPGTTQTSLRLSGSSNLTVFYTETDLTHPNVEMRVVMAGDKYTGVNGVSNMAIGKTTATEQYFAGVNADFFGNSAPVGSTVVDSEIYNLSNNGWTLWAMVDERTPVANEMSFSGTVSSASSSHNLSGVNIGRDTDYLVIYTNRKSNTSGTNVYGSEVTIEPVDGKTVCFGKTRYKVTSAPSTAGSMAIPAGQMVLSGNGTAATFVGSLAIGDELTVDITLQNGDNGYNTVKQMAGGKPMIVSGGKVLDTQGALDHLVSLNPRTAIGYDASGTKLVMLVVDGRSSVSAGVVSRQLADMMIQLGCSEAMNFDGGGSSALYVKGLGVRNRPSDGKERAVTNAVYAVSVAPEDNDVARLEFEQKTLELPRYSYYTPRVYAYNKYGVLIDNDFKGYSLSCPEALGSITSDGLTLYSNGSGYHALTAEVNGVTTSIPVEVSDANPRLRLESVLVDPYHDYTAEVVALVGETDVPVGNTALTWSSDDAGIATVDESGTVHGVSEGETVIRGEVDDIKLALAVKVEVPLTHYLNMYDQESVYTTAKSGTKDITVSPNADGYDATFTISSTRSPYLEVNCEATTFAIPDSLRLVINPGTANIKSVYAGYMSLTGRKSTRTYNVELPTEKNSVLLFPVTDFADLNERASFPLTLTGLRFYFNNTSGSTHTLSVKSYSFVYDNVPVKEDGVESVWDNADEALMIHPCVVERGHTVSVSEECDIAVVSLSGAVISSGHGSSFRAPDVPGMYLVRTGKGTAKLIVK